MAEKLLLEPRPMHSREPGKGGSLTQGLLQYRKMLCSFIYSLVRDVLVTEEIFQQVALVAIEKDRKADEEIREPAAWLRETAWRMVQAGFRTSQGRVITVDQEYLEQVAEVFESEHTIENQRARITALNRCMDKVSEGNREILRRHYLQGASYDQISAEVHRTSGALRVLVHRVVRQLMVCVENRLAKAEL
jgi:RNA polymerase sigma factor (sigma-70 family)